MGNRLDKVKKVIKDNFSRFNCGLYFTRNLAGDHMSTIYVGDGVTIDVCLNWGYFEVFGLTQEEKNELRDYYRSLEYKGY